MLTRGVSNGLELGTLCGLELMLTLPVLLSPVPVLMPSTHGMWRCWPGLGLWRRPSLFCCGLQDDLTSPLLTKDAYSCVTFYLSSVLNSVPDLPCVRRAAVQAWLEAVSGGSLVMLFSAHSP